MRYINWDGVSVFCIFENLKKIGEIRVKYYEKLEFKKKDYSR